MNFNIPVICIDDAGRPNEVPTSRWIKKGEKYHITEISRMALQGNIYGCKLAERDNDDLAPYAYFRLNRFAELNPDQQLNEEWENEDISELVEILEVEKVEV